MGFLAWIVFGGLVGWVASKLMGTDEQQGILANIGVGIVGALIGGFLASAITGTAVSGFNVMSFIIALIGAVILLWLIKAMRRPRSTA